MTVPYAETLDRLYLEWSQFTSARNARELELIAVLDEAINIIAVLAAVTQDKQAAQFLDKCTDVLTRQRGWAP